MMKFPTVTGYNLQRKKCTLPQDFAGEYNLVFIAFQQWQQKQVDTWIPNAQKLEQTYPQLRYYELPTIRRMNLLSRTFINEGMRMGIPNPISRERTITLYIDKKGFQEVLGLSNEQNIVVLLLNTDSDIIWRESGIFTQEKADRLHVFIQNNIKT
jgi:hypothetical protein